jgi:hypothetical protein
MRIRLTSDPELFKQAAAGAQKREIPDDFKYNAKKLKHLKHVLHNVTVALGTLTSSLNELSRVKGRDLSPDGLLGGKGYIMSFKEIKQLINGSVHELSNIADCIADELTNPRWDAKDDKEVKKLLKQKEDVEEQVQDIDPNEESSEEQDQEEQDQEELSEEQKEATDEISPDDLVTSDIRVAGAKALERAVSNSLKSFFQ